MIVMAGRFGASGSGRFEICFADWGVVPKKIPGSQWVTKVAKEETRIFLSVTKSVFRQGP